MYKYSWHRAACETVGMQVVGNEGNLSSLSAYFTDRETEIHTRDETRSCPSIPRENNYLRISIFLDCGKYLMRK